MDRRVGFLSKRFLCFLFTLIVGIIYSHGTERASTDIQTIYTRQFFWLISQQKLHPIRLGERIPMKTLTLLEHQHNLCDHRENNVFYHSDNKCRRSTSKDKSKYAELNDESGSFPLSRSNCVERSESAFKQFCRVFNNYANSPRKNISTFVQFGFTLLLYFFALYIHARIQPDIIVKYKQFLSSLNLITTDIKTWLPISWVKNVFIFKKNEGEDDSFENPFLLTLKNPQYKEICVFNAHYDHELNRVQSYKSFPGHCSESFLILSSCGFYYTKSGRLLECSCCRNRVDTNDLRDIKPSNSRFHSSPTCKFVDRSSVHQGEEAFSTYYNPIDLNQSHTDTQSHNQGQPIGQYYEHNNAESLQGLYAMSRMPNDDYIGGVVGGAIQDSNANSYTLEQETPSSTTAFEQQYSQEVNTTTAVQQHNVIEMPYQSKYCENDNSSIGAAGYSRRHENMNAKSSEFRSSPVDARNSWTNSNASDRHPQTDLMNSNFTENTMNHNGVNSPADSNDQFPYSENEMSFNAPSLDPHQMNMARPDWANRYELATSRNECDSGIVQGQQNLDAHSNSNRGTYPSSNRHTEHNTSPNSSRLKAYNFPITANHQLEAGTSLKEETDVNTMTTQSAFEGYGE